MSAPRPPAGPVPAPPAAAPQGRIFAVGEDRRGRVPPRDGGFSARNRKAWRTRKRTIAARLAVLLTTENEGGSEP